LYLGYQATESSDIQNTNSALLNDYSNNFITLNYEFFNFNSLSNKSVFTFLDASALNVKIGTGKRTSKFESNPQYFGSLNWNHNFYLNTKNVVNIKSQNYYLQSSTYIVNELYRFGGITSIRGFNENSLQGNVFTSLLTEYRYVLSPSIYAHSIIDYGYVQDRTSNVNSNLLGFGFGFGLLTKNGLFNLIYANGSTDEQQIKLSNSIVHISFKATF
jgi:hemolysin activation/secretion protein